MELELLADKRITIEIVIDEKELLAQMEKRMFNANDIATVRRKLAKGQYLASFKPALFDGDEGVVFLQVDGYQFNLDAAESQR